jgi:hypothetical protein
MGYSWNDFDRTYEMGNLIEKYADERVKQALNIADVVGTLCKCDGKIETTYDSEMNLVCKECYNQLLA